MRRYRWEVINDVGELLVTNELVDLVHVTVVVSVLVVLNVVVVVLSIAALATLSVSPPWTFLRTSDTTSPCACFMAADTMAWTLAARAAMSIFEAYEDDDEGV